MKSNHNVHVHRVDPSPFFSACRTSLWTRRPAVWGIEPAAELARRRFRATPASLDPPTRGKGPRASRGGVSADVALPRVACPMARIPSMAAHFARALCS
eukprot:15484768-Alexandrium_andersonii.AAC.1